MEKFGEFAVKLISTEENILRLKIVQQNLSIILERITENHYCA